MKKLWLDFDLIIHNKNYNVIYFLIYSFFIYLKYFILYNRKFNFIKEIYIFN